MTDQFFRPAGDEFHANDEISGTQDRPDIGALANGGFVTVWENRPFDSDDAGLIDGIYARVHGPDGTPVSDDILVGSAQSFARPSVDGLADGSFVVAWVRSNSLESNPDSSSRDIMARQFLADGSAIDDEFVLAQGAVPQRNGDGTRYVEEDHPYIAGLPDGGFAVSWQGNSEWVPDQVTSFGIGAWTNNVQAQIYNADATPRGVRISLNQEAMFDQIDPELAQLSDGNLVAVWTGAGRDVFAGLYSGDGTPITSDFRVNSFTEDDQQYPSIAPLVDGGFVVVWESENQDNGDQPLYTWGVFGQRFAEDGTPIGEEFLVNTTIEGNQDDPEVTATPDGGFVVAWSENQPGTSGDEVMVQRYDADGVPLGGEVAIEDFPDSITQAAQYRPAVDALENGDVALAWVVSDSIYVDERSTGIFGRVLETDMIASSTTTLDKGNSNINVEGTTNQFIDFGGLDTYTFLSPLSANVTIADNNRSIINLLEGTEITSALFLADGVRFVINGNMVTLLGDPSSFDFVLGGTPFDPTAGTTQSFAQMASTFGTTIPADGGPANAATNTGVVQSDGSITGSEPLMSLIGMTSPTWESDYAIM